MADTPPPKGPPPSLPRAHAAEDAASLETRLADAERRIAFLEAEVERAVRMRDETLSTVSHDLKNPISALLLGLQRLARFAEPGRRAQADALAARLERTAHGMTRFVEGLVVLARLDAGRLRLARRRVPVADVVARALEPLAPLAAERKQTLDRVVPEDLPAPEWDPDRVALALAHLAANAIRFAPEGGRVTVRAAREGDALRMAVSDDGPGLPAERAAALIGRSAPPTDAGRGIGLRVVRGVVHAHGGVLDVEGAPGAGTTVSFAIPLDAPAETVPTPRP